MGKNYIMRKMNQEKIATTEKRKSELEAKGYICVGVTDSGKQEEKSAEERKENKKEKAREAKGEGDGGRADNTGKD